MSIKYYHLAKDETTPEEFCAIRDVGGEPREYTFYVLDAENAKLREQLEYERQTSRSRLERIDQLKDESAKLRELARRYSEYTGQDRCEGCVYKSRCNDGYVDECWQLTEIRRLARELGIEVTE